MKDWFKKWFDSHYYHVLYKERNDKEAEFFLGNLIQKLSLPTGARVLDLACGKGRHCNFLNKKGFDVTGIDISEESIREAKKIENDSLTFYVHDMRKPFRVNYFDCILNLFTSFGYFDDHRDNEHVVNSVQQGLRPGGYFVIDFMNAEKVLRQLVKEETKTVGDIAFHIKRFEKNGCIFKEIRFKDTEKDHFFTERVQALKQADLKKYLDEFGLNTIHLFGDYELNDFDAVNSDRLIIVAQKA